MTLCRIKFFVGIFFLQMQVGSTATVTGSKKSAAVQNSKRGRINLNLKGVSLKNTLQMLCDRLGKNLLLSSDVGNRLLHMNLQNITPHDAFSVILQTNNLSYKAMAGNVWFVASSKRIGDRTIVKNIACKYADAGEMVKILSML